MIPSAFNILSYRFKNCLEVSRLFACRSLGHGSEKFRKIRSASPSPNQSLIYSASMRRKNRLGSSSTFCFSTALISTLENFSIPTKLISGFCLACSIIKEPLPMPISIRTGFELPKISLHFPFGAASSLMTYLLASIASRLPGTFLSLMVCIC